MPQTASKMWTLACYLPPLIGRNFDASDPHWLHYLKLLDIMDLVFSPTVQPETPAYLQVLINGHIETFTELYPNASVIPKIHFLAHVPRYLDE